MAETRDRSNFFDDSVRKRQKKKKKRERKKSSKMRGEKSDPLTMRLVVVKKKGRTGNYKSSFESHGVASFCNDKKHR